MTNQEYRRYACKLLGGIYDKELLSSENLTKILAMIKAQELELWEINPEILRLRLFHPELIEKSEKYLNSTPVKQRSLIDSEYYWMYQLIPAPPRLENFNDYFVRAIETYDHSFFSAFLHYYEPLLNKKARRFIETYAIGADYFSDLKQTFVSVLWEQFLKYDKNNKIPLLQIAKPPINDAWHSMVARQIGAVTMSAKMYAIWRKVAVIVNQTRDDRLSARELKERIRAELPEDTSDEAIDRALSMLSVWREAIPIINKSATAGDDEYDNNFVCEESIADTGEESVESELWCDEVRKAFKTAFLSLTVREKELFEKVHGVNPDTFEIFPPIDRETLALTYNYADESGVRKAEDEICIKIAAELCKIDFADAVYAKKISPPKNQPKAKNLIYYAYHPRCQKAGGVLVIDTDTEPDAENPFHTCHVVYMAEGEHKPRRYAYITAKMLVKEQKLNGKLPTRVFMAKRT